MCECNGLGALLLEISIIKPVVRYLQQWYIRIFTVTGTMCTFVNKEVAIIIAHVQPPNRPEYRLNFTVS